MAEAVGGVVGGELVVVEAVRAAPAGDLAAAGLEAQAHLAGDELLARVDERVEGLLQRREPEAVVDELGVAGLDAGLLPVEVALEADRLEVLVGHDERQAGRALVGLPALDADPAVLDHVDAAPAVGADDGVQPLDDLEHRRAARRRLDAGTPCSKPMTTSRGSVAVGLVSSHTPGGGTAHGSSISPHSMARPQRLSSIEYTFSFVAGIGISWRRRRGSTPRGSCPSPAPGRSPRGRGRAPGSTPRSAPGRCPCRCSRGRPRRRRGSGPRSTRCLTITGRDSADTSG